MRLINTNVPITAAQTEIDTIAKSTRSVNRILSVLTALVLLGAISLSVIVLINHNRPQTVIAQGFEYQQQRLLEQRP